MGARILRRFIALLSQRRVKAATRFSRRLGPVPPAGAASTCCGPITPPCDAVRHCKVQNPKTAKSKMTARSQPSPVRARQSSAQRPWQPPGSDDAANWPAGGRHFIELSPATEPHQQAQGQHQDNSHCAGWAVADPRTGVLGKVAARIAADRTGVAHEYKNPTGSI